jgi:hypothetical protein
VFSHVLYSVIRERYSELGIAAQIAQTLRCGYNVSMFPVLEDVAQKLNIAPDSLWRESLDAYMVRELRLTELDIADLQDRYGVVSPEELKAKIDSCDIYSHPAWEEMIEWENLAAYRERLTQLQASLS